MARKPRVHYEGAVYHVIARGNNQSRIFETDEEKEKYIRLLADYKERYGFRVYAYVIMDNHVHVLLQVGKNPLSKIMQGIQQRYTQFYNSQHKQSGHVFEQRYKALLCEQERYLFALVCYIHQNPVRANLPEGIDYTWSSHKSYVKYANGLVDVSFVLNSLSSEPNAAIKQYIHMLGAVVIEPEYGAGIKNNKEDKTNSLKITEDKNTQPNVTWEQLVAQITEEEKVDQDQLVGRCRVRRIVAARKRLIFEAIERNLMTRTQLANILQIDPANITRIWQEMVKFSQMK